MGKGGGGDTSASRALAGYINQISGGAAKKLRQTGLQQGAEALKTGGVGAQIPLIQRSVENSRMATGQALQQTTNQLSQAGLAGTPYGQSAIASTRTAGDLQTSQIGPSMAAQFATGVLPEAFNVSGTAVSGLGQLSAEQQQSRIAGQQAQSQEIAGGTAALGAIIAAALLA